MGVGVVVLPELPVEPVVEPAVEPVLVAGAEEPPPEGTLPWEVLLPLFEPDPGGVEGSSLPPQAVSARLMAAMARQVQERFSGLLRMGGSCHPQPLEHACTPCNQG